MSNPTLPAALAPWSETLSVLEPRLAMAVGPLVRQLDHLFARHDSGTGSRGELDGYSGLARRGEPAQLLMSELAIAQEHPVEFLRRAVMSELLYLAPSYIDDLGRGRVCVLVDAGPDQIGAGRLVQLAGLVVLHRRAFRRRSELVVGVLGDEPGIWRAGDVKQILRGWLSARRIDQVDAEEIEPWAGELDRADELWLFAGRRLGVQVAGRRRTVVSAECAWSHSGASAVEVMLDGDRVELALPHGDVAVRALRGAAFREPAPTLVPGRLRFPTFPSAGPWLLGRGTDPSEVIAVPVPDAGRPAGRVRRHRFGGPVITSAFIGRRLVALVLVAGALQVEVRGKQLGRVDRMAVALSALGLDRDTADGVSAGPMTGLVYDRGALLVRLADTWWRLAPDADPEPDGDILAVLPDTRPDVPRIARLSGFRDGPGPRLDQSERTEFALGPDRLIAWRDDAARWIVVPGGRSVPISPDDRVIGLARIDEAPALLTVSSAGLIVRLNWPGGQRTLTKWSGGATVPALHPQRPWIAVQRDDHRVEVADLETGALLLTVPGEL